jgi:hypothetical protein
VPGPSVADEIETSKRLWREAMREVERFTALGSAGAMKEAETHRINAVALMEAGLDALARAHRLIHFPPAH